MYRFVWIQSGILSYLYMHVALISASLGCLCPSVKSVYCHGITCYASFVMIKIGCFPMYQFVTYFASRLYSMFLWTHCSIGCYLLMAALTYGSTSLELWQSALRFISTCFIITCPYMLFLCMKIDLNMSVIATVVLPRLHIIGHFHSIFRSALLSVNTNVMFPSERQASECYLLWHLFMSCLARMQ